MNKSNNHTHETKTEIFSFASQKKTQGKTPPKANTPLSLKNKLRQRAQPKPVSREQYQDIYEEMREIDPNETIVWVGRSTQMIHFAAYFFCFLFGWMIFPLFIAWYLYLRTKHTVYIITNQRLRVYSGIISRRIDDVELYRVKDTIYIQPFLLGRFGFSNIQLITSDATWGDSFIPGVTDGRMLREKIRKIVEAAREKKGVREIDYYTRSSTTPLS